jgi:hypothetical protein
MQKQVLKTKLKTKERTGFRPFHLGLSQNNKDIWTFGIKIVEILLTRKRN